jgi:secreted trypsin-like serine protease
MAKKGCASPNSSELAKSFILPDNTGMKLFRKLKLDQRTKAIIAVAFALFAAGALLVIVSEITGRQINPKDTSAIFGGTPETSYQVTGFLVHPNGDNSFELCSVGFLTPIFGVTAAHCLERPGDTYVGNGQFTSDLSKLTKIRNPRLHPSYVRGESVFDVAVFELEKPVVLDSYAQVVEPVEGCNYTIVGYGRTEADPQNSISPERPRLSIDVCLTVGSSLLITGKNSGVCSGDSGSPVYIKNTNKIVGILSGIDRLNTTDDPCFIGNISESPVLSNSFNFISGRITDQAISLATSTSNQQIQSSTLVGSETAPVSAAGGIGLVFMVCGALLIFLSLIAALIGTLRRR